jgi:hypothetical protein
MASRLEIQEVLDDGDDGSASWCGLSDRHAALIRDKSLSFLSLGPQDQMLCGTAGGRAPGWMGPAAQWGRVYRLRDRGFDVRQVQFGGAAGDEYIVRFS